jgi:hypothetical protein
MSDVVIPGTFTGPPDSANGGYASGVVAQMLVTSGAIGEGEPVEVTLRRPPPLDHPLRASTGGGRAALVDGSTGEDGGALVAEAVPAELDATDTPAPITLDDARRAEAAFDIARYTANHPFPTCFTCSPTRSGEDGDGLRIFPGAIAPHVVAWPWTPDAALVGADDDGLVDGLYLWAALDCPSGLCWLHDEPDAGPHVLGRMTALIHRRPAPGEPLVVAGWTIATAGRKRLSGSAIWDGSGAVVADNRSTWIALDERTATTFRPATSPS